MASFTSSDTESYVTFQQEESQDVLDSPRNVKGTGEEVVSTSSEYATKAYKRTLVKLLVGCLLGIVVLGIVGVVAYIALKGGKDEKPGK